MADWSKILSRGKVVDRRAMGPGAIGGLGVAGIAIVLLVNILGGGNIVVGNMHSFRAIHENAALIS